VKLCRLLIVVIPALFLLNCQTATVTYDEYFTESYDYSRWLPMIEDGESKRSQIQEKLGPPSRTFEEGRIVTYRIMINEWKNGLSESLFFDYCSSNYPPFYDSYYDCGRIPKNIADKRFESLNKDGVVLVLTEENKSKYEKEIIAGILEFDLILVFDCADILKRHALVRIQP